MYELFIEILNLMFWDGYAEQLIEEHPAQFEKEFNQFVSDYYC